MGIRILVIEDEANIADFIVRGLREEGFCVERAADGEEGWHCLKTGTWDVVLLDWWLPATDGLTLLQRFRQVDQTTPVLFLSGKGDLTRDFSASIIQTPPELPSGAESLKLVPRTRQADYDWLIVAVEPRSLAIVGLVTVDAQGGTSSFSFTNLKENVGLADKAFAFKIPRGVDVVTDFPTR